MFKFILFSLITLSAYAAPDLVKLVPQSTIAGKTKTEIKLKTKAGTIVEIGIDDEGEMEEASGSLADKGDEFEPGDKSLSLKAVVEILKKEGKKLQGEWTYEENEEGDWVYDFEGIEKNKDVDYIVNATTGKILKTELDD
ncbi:MAG: PepSY domain-containing protein [Bacteriovoracaceae bacterium]|nr:PepSY domain-containing protein [Bacteriovoracaceae bacterium]